MSGLGGLPLVISSRAGIQTQNGRFSCLIKERFFSATILKIAFLFSLTTESSMASSPPHAFSSHLTLYSFHPFCLSVPGSSSFSGLPWKHEVFFTGFFPLFGVLILSLIRKNPRAGSLPGLAVILL